MMQSYAEQLSNQLVVGNIYNLADIANYLDMQFQAVKGKGVIPKADTDVVVILVTLEKEKTAVQYFDQMVGSTLFWSGQNKLRTVENYIDLGSHQFFVFMKERKGLPYLYYGRAVPLRIRRSYVYGVPSQIVFDMYEYSQLTSSATMNTGIFADNIPEYEGADYQRNTEMVAVQKIRTAQTLYRDAALSLWNNKCAVTAVDDKGWLIASHIKPWRESSDNERIDPKNSLVLTPNYEKLFARGVITFNPDNGKIKLPDVLPRELWLNLSRLNIDDTVELRNVPSGTDKYLAYHNKYVFNFTPQCDDVFTSEYVENLLVRALS